MGWFNKDRKVTKYTLTTIDKLKPGDQFVKQKDKSETVFTVLDLNSNSRVKFYARKGDLKMTDIVDVKEPIIFLRHEKSK